VQALRAHAGRWQALDDSGRVCGEADVVVLAAAQDAARLAGDPAWPAAPVRGQATRLPPGSMAPPRLPIAGAGYAIALPDGTVWCGATAHAGDDDATLREADHAYNIERLSRLAGGAAIAAPLDGRVGWRFTARDRMPILGALPVPNAVERIDRPRLVPRVPGLFVHTALGSRGIAWSVLNAQVLSSAIAGAPLPLERSLLESIDPARFAARAIRKSAS
jgi:tRNA 5-methylaminomethyl-2-thiouridine biosynthesis bifunctional protein